MRRRWAIIEGKRMGWRVERGKEMLARGTALKEDFFEGERERKGRGRRCGLPRA
ncbi:uncharacterized protein BKA78DRAFT_327394 [Phyllosticta capitalensis]|uniref:uncharacterized protein n=1 Tax=Phyllosticta capitalensis TaxID=121624 RepID=UPI00312D201F